MNENIDGNLKKALRDADRRFQLASKNYFWILARVRDAAENNAIPASCNDEWCEAADDLQEAEAALNKIVTSIIGDR